MTIAAIYVGNFKAFANTQETLVRPLTLVFGPNIWMGASVENEDRNRIDDLRFTDAHTPRSFPAGAVTAVLP